ncbi:ABC transporter ATP-binding protein [Thermicanus aegyptius]|uniref:ABC transporter ATP-binding protein n=1 Tax=Thermicanus aegyptius TaxID=94009 RepID=UPI00040C3A1C|nr:ABC transporter ATP-binding protein [Thermicanus aegyptius]
MGDLLDVEGITGGYSYEYPVLHHVSFSVKKGEIVALLGLNGAGKSTLIKHILGFLKPFKGKITIDGKHIDENPQEYRRKFAYIPEMPIYYENLTLGEHLRFAAKVYGLTDEEVKDRLPRLLKEFNMEGKEELFPSFFSKGMKQKMMIMAALLVRPALYVIDEPLLGLDPLGIRSLLQALVVERERGAGIFMSTHILSTAERYCDRFLILHQGKLIASGTLQELRRGVGAPHASLDEIYLQWIERGEEK